MPSRIRQGQSSETIDKERRIGAALSVSMRIANKAFGGKGYRYWHFDANAGCGYNHAARVPGSPVVFWEVAGLCLTAMQPAPYFCDIDAIATEQLRNRFASISAAAGSTVWTADNQDALMSFGQCIEGSERARYAIGSVVVDPNGWFYRSGTGIGAPVTALPWFARRFPRIDLILNLNTRTFHLQRGAGHDVMQPRDVLASLNRSYWLVARAGGQNRHLLAIGRNLATGDHKALGFHHADSDQGRAILDVDRANVPDPDLLEAI